MSPARRHTPLPMEGMGSVQMGSGAKSQTRQNDSSSLCMTKIRSSVISIKSRVTGGRRDMGECETCLSPSPTPCICS